MVGQRDVELFLACERRACGITRGGEEGASDGVEKKMEAWTEEGVNLEKRVVAEALKVVGETKRRVELDVEEGRDVLGRRTRGRVKRLG